MYTPDADQIKYRYQLDVGNSPIAGRTFDEAGEEFDRWLANHEERIRLEVNPYPLFDERYDAAKSATLGDQLRPDEITERVRIELENAFASGAFWQYGRRQLPSDAGSSDA
jgi:hypothetical protein